MDGIGIEDFERQNRLRKRRQYLITVADKMKERKVSRAEIGRQTGRSGSHIGQILLGCYPYRGAWYWPKYFEDWIQSHFGIVAP